MTTLYYAPYFIIAISILYFLIFSCVVKSKDREKQKMYLEWSRLFFNVIQVLATITAILLAIGNPFEIKKQERLDQLMGYRDLACFVVRYLDPKATKDPSLLTDQTRVVTDALNAIDLKAVYPSILLSDFVDIRFYFYVITQDKQWQRNILNNDLEKRYALVKQELSRIDAFLEQNGKVPDNLVNCGDFKGLG